MISLILYAGEQSDVGQAVVWLLLVGAIVTAVVLMLLQMRKGKELKFELEQLGKIQKHNIEFEFVLKAMNLYTWHIDPKTRVITTDNDFRAQRGDKVKLSEQAQQSEYGRYVNEQDMARVSAALDDICEGRTSDYHVQYRVMLPHNRFYWEESYATVAERDTDGKPSSIVGTSMRIDDRKQMEEELVQARNRAEESDRLKSAFIANMSHEIRTPLNAIVGFTSILPDMPEGPERQQLMDLIHENTQKLLRIVDDVVNISKVEAGKDELVLSSFNLNDALNEQYEKYKVEMKDGVTFTKDYARESQEVLSDRSRVVEVIDHLLSNAVKFTTSGNITIGYKEPSGGRIRIWVSDTGKGIAPEMQERVFERFFKVDEFVPGAGLGLSICRTMAYSLGGTVSCESKLGEGSTFWFEIPIQ